MTRRKVTVGRVRPAGADHAVITLKSAPLAEGDSYAYRREPCPNCPWRVDATGEFPAEAFKHSAPTAYDMAQNGAIAKYDEAKATTATTATTAESATA